MSEWISVKDGLPEYGKSVLVVFICANPEKSFCEPFKAKRIKTDKNGEHFLACCDEESVMPENHTWENITHWQELPTPPQGEG